MLIPPRAPKKELRIAGETALEQEAVKARLQALGVEGTTAKKDAQVIDADLIRVSKVDGALDLDALENLSQSHRAFGAWKVDLKLGDPVAAKAAINDQLGKLKQATAKLNELKKADAERPPSQRLDLLGGLSKLFDEIAAGVLLVRKPETLRYLSKAELDQMIESHRLLLEGYGAAATAISKDAEGFGASTAALRQFSALLDSLSRVLAHAPLFTLGGAAIEPVDVPFTAAKDRFKDIGKVVDLMTLLDLRHPSADPHIRRAQLLPLFDTPFFVNLTDEHRGLWAEALGGLSSSRLQLVTDALLPMVKVPGFTELPAEAWSLAVNLLTKLPSARWQGRVDALRIAAEAGALEGPGASEAIKTVFKPSLSDPASQGILDAGDLQRIQNAVAELEAHDKRALEPIKIELPRQAELDRITTRLADITAWWKAGNPVAAEHEAESINLLAEGRTLIQEDLAALGHGWIVEAGTIDWFGHNTPFDRVFSDTAYTEARALADRFIGAIQQQAQGASEETGLLSLDGAMKRQHAKKQLLINLDRLGQLVGGGELDKERAFENEQRSAYNTAIDRVARLYLAAPDGIEEKMGIGHPSRAVVLAAIAAEPNLGQVGRIEDRVEGGVAFLVHGGPYQNAWARFAVKDGAQEGFLIKDGFLDYWLKDTLEEPIQRRRDVLGLPTGPEIQVEGVWTQAFERGTLHWTQEKGVWFVGPEAAN